MLAVRGRRAARHETSQRIDPMQPRMTDRTHEEPPRPPEPRPEEWFIYSEGEVSGPLTLREMDALARTGRLTKSTQATRRTPPEWKNAVEDARLAPLFEATSWKAEAPIDPMPGPWRAEDAPPRLSVKPKQGAAKAAETAQKPAPLPDTARPALTPLPAETETHPPASDDVLPPTVQPAEARMPAPIRAKAAPPIRPVQPNTNDSSPPLVGLASLILPGLGQLLNRNFWKAGAFAFGVFLLWGTGLGWIVHIWAGIDAARSALSNERKRQAIEGQDPHRKGRNE